ncbi:MAG: helix-turn-helix domain-containing protein [Oscillospiraceae bacterium]|nr:helix-turn-helix domain-containing protein [Oscillospiraceae bacterium]
MSFSKQLDALLDICRVSNAALARELDVDASLVSRWKSGGRRPSAETVAEVAACLARQPLRARDRAFLCALLEMPPDAAPENLASEMERYLLERPAKQDSRRADRDTLLAGLCALLQQDGAAALRGPVNLWPRVQKGQPVEHQLFSGPVGKRQAAVNFMYATLAASRKTELFLLLPASDWIDGDPAFRALFSQALYAFAQRGGQICLIHGRPADAHDLFALLSGLLPHYLTGRVFSYTLAEHGAPAAPTLFVTRGLCAMVSGAAGEAESTALFQHAADAARYESLFKEYMTEATPLASACAADDPLGQARALADLEWQPGDYHVATRALSPLWLPPAFFPEAARQTAGALPLLARRREAFEAFQGRWVEIWPETLLQGIERGRAELSLGGVCGMPPFLLSGEGLKAYLSALLSALRARETFHILLSPSLTGVGLLAHKRGAGAILAPEGGSQPAALSLRDAAALSLLDGWYAAQAVAAKDKEWVVSHLENILRRMENEDTATA